MHAKRHYLKYLLCFILFSLVLFLPFPKMTSMGQAEARTASPPEADMEREITRIILPYTDSLLLAETQNARETLRHTVERSDYTRALARFRDGGSQFYPIRYDLDSLDTSQTGFTYLQGIVEIPDDGSVICQPEWKNTALPVFLYSQDAPCELPVVSRDALRTGQATLPQHASLEDLEHNMYDVQVSYLYLEHDIWLETDLIWDFHAIDFDTPGTYQITATNDLPKGLLLSDEFQPFTYNVIIQDTETLTLSPPVFHGLYFFSYWMKPTPQPELLRAYYAIGEDGEWQEDTNKNFIQIDPDSYQRFTIFYYENVFFETPYYFRLEYDGEMSNTLKIYLTEDQLSYDLFEGDRDGGDREEQTPPSVVLPPVITAPPDVSPLPEETLPGTPLPEETLPPETSPGNVSSGQNRPSGGHSGPSGNAGASGSSGDTQTSGEFGYGPGYPAVMAISELLSEQPEMETGTETNTDIDMEMKMGEKAPLQASPFDAANTGRDISTSDTPSSFQESDTADYTILSGRRILKQMERNPDQPLLFTKHRMRLEIPTNTGFFSDITEDNYFKAELQPLDDDKIFVAFTMNGLALSELPPLTITVPWKADSENAVLEIRNQDGEVLTTAVYQDSSLVFTLEETGTFTIAERAFAGDSVVELPMAAAPEPTNGSVSASATGQAARLRTILVLCLPGICVPAAGIFVLRGRMKKRRR